MSATKMGVEEVARHFHELEDPRSEVNRLHPLESVVVIALLAVLAGASGPTSIAQWAKLKRELLVGVLDLPHGVPGKDVFRRVLCLLNPAAFQVCFANWLTALKSAAAAAAGVAQPVFAVDGKTLRRSHDRRRGLGPLHSVSVWASEYGLSLGQVACAEKSNEITAIPELLRLVDIEGAIITIDAMGTQKTIAKTIIERKADFVLALKGNQEKLHDAAIAHLDEQLEQDFADVEVRQLTTTDRAHGRVETRHYYQVPAPRDLPGRADWAGLQTIGLVLSVCVRDGQETIEKRCYLSSLPLGVQVFARAVRGHWAIENSCHWSLDVTFREDESRLRHHRARQNFAWLNRYCLSLLKQHPGQGTLASKRRACGWDDDYLLQLLTGATS